MNRTRSLSTVRFGHLLPLCHVSRGVCLLAQFGCGTALAAILLLTFGSAQLAVAQTTIQVTTTQQGITDPAIALCKKRFIPRNLPATQP